MNNDSNGVVNLKLYNAEIDGTTTEQAACSNEVNDNRSDDGSHNVDNDNG